VGVFRFALIASVLGMGLAIAACIDRDPDPKSAAGAARALQHMVGRTAGPVTIVSIAAERTGGEDVLVVTFDGAAGWRRGMPSQTLSAPFLDGFCHSPRGEDYFADGRALRLDTLEAHDGRIPGAPVHRCPAR